MKWNVQLASSDLNLSLLTKFLLKYVIEYRHQVGNSSSVKEKIYNIARAQGMSDHDQVPLRLRHAHVSKVIGDALSRYGDRSECILLIILSK